MLEKTSVRSAPPPLDDTIALFLDVDGALLPFADTPDGVRVPPSLRTRLGSLYEQLDGALALVSGRRIDTLDALFAPLRLPCAGLHGLERRHGDKLEQAPVASAEALARVREAGLRVAEKYDGALVEDKGPAIAFHWRGDELAAADFEGLAAMAVMELPGYHLQYGNRVVELKPQGADKGTAIGAFLQETPFAGRMPVFVGDDLTDEYGFEVVNLRGGVSVLVGPREPSVARYALHDVAAVHRWLGVASEVAA
jgi:trehalose 6-phosphate phosphatase